MQQANNYENSVQPTEVDQHGTEHENCSNINNLSTPNSTLANIKQKTPICLMKELAKYNKIQYQYQLKGEQGPGHEKIFTVTLKLGSEEYEAEGSSIKKAYHSAAAQALKKTKFKYPPPKTIRNIPGTSPTIPDVVAPTMELNTVAMNRGERTVHVVENGGAPPHQGYITQPGYYPRHNIYNTQTQPQRFGYDTSRNIRGHYPYHNSLYYGQLPPGALHNQGYIMQPGYYPRHNIYNTHTQPQRYGYDASRNIRGHYPYHDSLYYGQLPPGALHNQGYITQPGYYPRHNIYNTQTQPQRYGYDGSRNIRGPYPYHNSLYYGQLPPGALHNQGYITQPGYYPRHTVFNTQTQPQRYAYDACRNIRGPYPYHDSRSYVQFQPGTLHNPGDPYTARLDSTTGIPANFLVRR